jgi:DNA polymerase-3 subunit gamma/tau
VDTFIDSNVAEALLIFNDILNHGFDALHFISGLNQHLRDLLVSFDGKTTELLEVAESVKQKYIEQSKKVGIAFLFRALQVTNACEINFKSSQNQRLHVEIAILNLCNLSVNSSFNVAQLKQETNSTPTQQKETQKIPEPVQKKTNPLTSNPLNTSINSVLNAQGKSTIKKEDTVQNIKKERNAEFTEEQLVEAWKIMGEAYKGSPQVHSLVTSVLPVLKPGFIIEIPLSSEFQRKSIENSKDALITLLIDKLDNSKIKFEYNVSEQARPKNIYTNEDKYRYLNEKNEKLEQLRQRFNLDFG